jgi:parvulin-like peptidyl-prolyl isomerase
MVDGSFGAGFFEAVSRLAHGAWDGPVTSAFGPHLVLLEEARAAKAPVFEAVRAAVEADWRQEKAAELRAAQYQALLGRYRVVVPADAP